MLATLLIWKREFYHTMNFQIKVGQKNSDHGSSFILKNLIRYLKHSKEKNNLNLQMDENLPALYYILPYFQMGSYPLASGHRFESGPRYLYSVSLKFECVQRTQTGTHTFFIT